MNSSLRNVAALIVTLTILQLSAGLIGVRLPLAFAADGYSRASLGLVVASYSAGFMLGAVIATTMLARVGHIRVYAASAAIFAAATLSLHFAGDVWSWGFARFMCGVVAALMFASVESWMAWSISKRERGEVMSVYQVAIKASAAIGPYLAVTYASTAGEPWMIAAGVAALSIAPICFTTSAQPDPPKAQPLALVEQFYTAPAAVIACFGAGFVNAGVLALAPLYAAQHFGSQAAAEFYAAAMAGSLLLQWPAGLLSDRMDRRTIIILLNILAMAAAIALALFSSTLTEWAAVLLFFAWGAGAISFYSIAAAHMADRVDTGKLAQSAAGLLFVWAAGSIMGPISLGFVVDALDVEGMFWFAAASALLIALAMLWRRGAREQAPQAHKEEFAPYTESSVAAGEIAKGEDKPQPI